MNLAISPEIPGQPASAQADSAPHTLVLSVSGMTCGGCAGRVERLLAARPGVAAARVNLALEQAELDLAPSGTDLAAAADALREAGFGAREETATFALQGLSCAGCASRARKALLAVPGVIGAEVDLALERAEARRLAAPASAPLPDPASDAALVEALTRAGYPATPVAPEAPPPDADVGAARRDLIDLGVAALLTAPLLAQMLTMLINPAWQLPGLVQAALAAPVWLWCGRRFHRGAWTALRGRAANMDTLVSLGTTASVLVSLWALASAPAGATPHLYFEAAAVIVTLVLLGKWLETRARRAASAALRELMALRPASARLLRAGQEVEVPIAEVSVGDMVVLRPGERAPVDGVVARGESEFDESLITGEPLPVLRAKGDAVPAGAINGPGLVRLRAERVGADSTLARIARLVAQAQTGKAPVQRLVDRIAAVFVPAVLVLAGLTLAGWLVWGGSADAAISAALSVLVIACPCALGLATPTALVAGTGAAARAGILIRDIATLERAARVDWVVFDKTGTLTRGKPELAEMRAFQGEEAELLRLAASLQQGSEHPLGRAAVAAAAAREDLAPLSPAEDFRAVIGQGAEATVDGARLRIGRQDFAAPEADAALRRQALAMAGEGRTVVWLARVADGGRAPLGLLALSDALREDAAQAVGALRARGVESSLLTGDAEPAARAVADAVGIAHVEAAMRPEGKAEAIAALIRAGRRPAMVGDGINDAPALAAAEIGIAMGGGADAALETAGVTLMRPRPLLVAASLDIARATSARIRENLFWAFAWNALCIPVAAFGLLDPALAGAAMALSSVCVATNSLRLTRWTPKI